jgi:hypothetical protein
MSYLINDEYQKHMYNQLKSKENDLDEFVDYLKCSSDDRLFDNRNYVHEN